MTELIANLPLLEKVEGPLYIENILTSDLQSFNLILENLHMKTISVWDIPHFRSFCPARFRICI